MVPLLQRAPAASGLGLPNSGGGVGGRGEPCGFAAALGRRWRVAHNSTGPTTAKRGIYLTRKRSSLHLTNPLPWSWLSGPLFNFTAHYPPGSNNTLSYKGITYHLTQFHFHHPAEHLA